MVRAGSRAAGILILARVAVVLSVLQAAGAGAGVLYIGEFGTGTVWEAEYEVDAGGVPALTGPPAVFDTGVGLPAELVLDGAGRLYVGSFGAGTDPDSPLYVYGDENGDGCPEAGTRTAVLPGLTDLDGLSLDFDSRTGSTRLALSAFGGSRSQDIVLYQAAGPGEPLDLGNPLGIPSSSSPVPVKQGIALALNPVGNLFVLDASSGWILVLRDLDHDGVPDAGAPARFNPLSGERDYFVDLAFDTAGVLYVLKADLADPARGRILVYRGEKSNLETSEVSPAEEPFASTGISYSPANGIAFDRDHRNNGLLFLSSPARGAVIAYWDLDHDGVADNPEGMVLVNGLREPAGIAAQPFAPDQRDTDRDGVPDYRDNCREVSNPAPGPGEAQPDDDGDGIGNACDTAECGTVPGTGVADRCAAVALLAPFLLPAFFIVGLRSLVSTRSALSLDVRGSICAGRTRRFPVPALFILALRFLVSTRPAPSLDVRGSVSGRQPRCRSSQGSSRPGSGLRFLAAAAALLFPLAGISAPAAGITFEAVQKDYTLSLEGQYRLRVLGIDPIKINGPKPFRIGYGAQRLRTDLVAAYQDKVSVHCQLNILNGVILGDNGVWGDVTRSEAGLPLIPNEGVKTSALVPNDGQIGIGLLDPSFNPLAPESYGPVFIEADPIEVSRIWGEVMLPFGLLRAGRQPATVGRSILVNDGDGLTNDFGCSKLGDTADRVLIGTKPLEILKVIRAGMNTSVADPSLERGLITVFGYDFLAYNSIADNGENVQQLVTGLFYRKPGFTLLGAEGRLFEARFSGAYRWGGVSYHYLEKKQMVVDGVLRSIDEEVSQSLPISLFLLTGGFSFFLGPVNLDVELAGTVGTTEEVPGTINEISPGFYPSDRLKVRAWGAQTNLRYRTGDWEFALEFDYASGDKDPRDDVAGEFMFAEDTNVGMLLFEEVIAFNRAQSAAAGTWNVLNSYQALGRQPPSNPSTRVATNGGSASS